MSENSTKSLEESEQILEQLASNNYGEVVLFLSNLLSIEKIELNKRKLSASLLNNMISKSHQNKEKWITLDPQIKKTIRGNIICTLASQYEEIVNASAYVIAGKFFFKLFYKTQYKIISIKN